MNDKNLKLMDEIMCAIVQLDAWDDIRAHDPMISDSEDRWWAAMKKAESLIPDELYNELCDAHFAEASDTGSAGILFGIHIANAIRDVAARPTDLSRHIMERMKKQ